VVTTTVLTGLIRERDEPDDVVIDDEPVAEALLSFRDRPAFACYAISDRPIAVADLLTANIMEASGAVEADYDVAYSEVTGYLWTDEEGTIGGHDLVKEFRSAAGRQAALVLSDRPIDLTVLVESLAHGS
jgi:hypothetical protein